MYSYEGSRNHAGTRSSRTGPEAIKLEKEMLEELRAGRYHN